MVYQVLLIGETFRGQEKAHPQNLWVGLVKNSRIELEPVRLQQRKCCCLPSLDSAHAAKRRANFGSTASNTALARPSTDPATDE